MRVRGNARSCLIFLRNVAQNALESVTKEEILHLGSQKSQPAVVKIVLDAMLLVLRCKIRPIEMQDARSYRDSFAFALELLSVPDNYALLQSV